MIGRETVTASVVVSLQEKVVVGTSLFVADTDPEKLELNDEEIELLRVNESEKLPDIVGRRDNDTLCERERVGDGKLRVRKEPLCVTLTSFVTENDTDCESVITGV